ncbi:MAG TPA: tRNA (N6-isopentenyl adenosine(37)-C2)-methylthiotransferase MiaB [Spirochaetota bacterium]|nr:tRNA (N6-isopentenyl adenosine(37)-C2)-methylthiotransferase MiaB [Spirochaetota bacterium]
MNFFIETYGCQMNKADSNSVIQNLINNGFREVFSPSEAKLIIINTCSVRKTAENRIWGRIGSYKNLKKKHNLIILVMGCMSQRVGLDFFNESPLVDIVVGTFYKDKIPDIVINHKKGQRVAFVDEKKITFGFSHPDIDNPKKAYITISHGCNNFCSYCIVPYLRGREASRSSNEIIEDINNLTKLGVMQVTLLGQNVNSYGNDTNDVDFPTLLKRISKETDIKWIKYLSSHPKDFSDSLIEVIVNEKKVSKWLHLAVQSGSNKILQKMNRHYKIESYIEKVNKLKQLTPNLNLTTDIIVGFPSETEEDFNETVNLINQVQFDDAFLYKYNIRENTLAAKELIDDVTEEEKLKRLDTIIKIQRNIQRNNKHKKIGTILDILPEKFSKKGDDEIFGVSQEELMILFKGTQSDFDKINKVRITKVLGGTLYGEKVQDL